MAETWLLTGIAGLVGRHVADRLERTGATVVGLERPGVPDPAGRVIHALDFATATVRELEQMLDRVQPTHIVHLAGVVRGDDDDVMAVNHRGTAHLLRAVEAQRNAGRSDPRIVLAGSAAEYGAVAETDNPIRETTALRPLGAYGVSKAAATLEAVAAALRGVGVCTARMFNVLGPGLTTDLLPGTVASQLRAMLQDPDKPRRLEIGDLSPTRDFVDVEDAAAALLLLARSGGPGEVYNVGSGRETRLRDLIDGFLGRMPWPVEVVPVQGRMRRVDVARQQADITKIGAATGWHPTISLEASIAKMLECASPGARG